MTTHSKPSNQGSPSKEAKHLAAVLLDVLAGSRSPVA